MGETADDFSRTFYPFLHQSSTKPQELIEGLRHSLLEKAKESARVKNRFFEENHEAILAVSLAMARAFHHHHQMFVCGNGGSAADAQHIAVEFMHPITVGRKALPVICLVNDLATVTAVANDVGIAHVFSRQLVAMGKEGDLMLGISTSGNAENLLNAFDTARRLKLVTIGLAGNDGGKMAEMQAQGRIDYCLTVPTPSIHRIQETQVTLYHIIWDLVHEMLPHQALMTGSDDWL